ncbi:hypothetical protein ACJX0J_019144 [Zea mays]
MFPNNGKTTVVQHPLKCMCTSSKFCLSLQTFFHTCSRFSREEDIICDSLKNHLNLLVVTILHHKTHDFSFMVAPNEVSKNPNLIQYNVHDIAHVYLLLRIQPLCVLL